MAQGRSTKRRGRDSNPRSPFRKTQHFQCCTIDHSVTSPGSAQPPLLLLGLFFRFGGLFFGGCSLLPGRRSRGSGGLAFGRLFLLPFGGCLFLFGLRLFASGPSLA